MKLTEVQSQKLLRERSVWVTEACDKCGRLLGSVRWTRRGELGEWCSAECRDGIRAAVMPLGSVCRKRIGARPAGRPRKHADNAEKCRHYRQTRKNGLATRNTPSEQIENAQLADANKWLPRGTRHPGDSGARNGCFRKLSFGGRASLTRDMTPTQNSGETVETKKRGRIQNLKPWKPGQSGNPGGRPKHDVASGIARAVFEGNEEAIYQALCKALLKGNPRVFVALAERAYGKLREPVELSVMDGLAERLEEARRRVQK
jgi:hypothetical protein